jgi:hypothetical protein
LAPEKGLKQKKFVRKNGFNRLILSPLLGSYITLSPSLFHALLKYTCIPASKLYNLSFSLFLSLSLSL